MRENIRVNSLFIYKVLLSTYYMYYFFTLIPALESVIFTSRWNWSGHTYLSYLCLGLGLFSSVALLFSKTFRWSCLFLAFSIWYLNSFSVYISHSTVALQILILITLFMFTKKDEFMGYDWARPLHLLVSFAFFTSGLSKLYLPEWLSGQSMSIICKDSTPMTWLFQDYCSWPTTYFTLITYLALFLELISLLAFVEKYRKTIWYLQLFLSMGILIHVAIFQIMYPLTLALILIGFTFYRSLMTPIKSTYQQ